MSTDTRDIRAIKQIACPQCGAKQGEECYVTYKQAGEGFVRPRFTARNGRPQCCLVRRKANQERVRKNLMEN